MPDQDEKIKTMNENIVKIKELLSECSIICDPTLCPKCLIGFLHSDDIGVDHRLCGIMTILKNKLKMEAEYGNDYLQYHGGETK